MAEIQLNKLAAVVQEYASEFQRITKQKLIDGDKVASGALLASIKTRVELNGNVYTVWLDSKDYLKYVDKGTKPHFPPSEPILKWVREKKSIQTREKTGNKNMPTEKQVTYLVQRKIGREGTKETKIVATTVEELNAQYITKMENALLEDVTDNLSIIHIQLNFK